jgi:hypothetical protein
MPELALVATSRALVATGRVVRVWRRIPIAAPESVIARALPGPDHFVEERDHEPHDADDHQDQSRFIEVDPFHIGGHRISQNRPDGNQKQRQSNGHLQTSTQADVRESLLDECFHDWRDPGCKSG